MQTGRPTVMTEAVLLKLEEAFAMGCPDTEACLYADISPSSLYKYQEEHPEFSERKAQLKEKPVLLARTTVLKSLAEDTNSAWRMLERKDPDLHPKQQIDHTTKGEKIDNSPLISQLAEQINAIHRGTSVPGDGIEASALGTETPNTNV